MRLAILGVLQTTWALTAAQALRPRPRPAEPARGQLLRSSPDYDEAPPERDSAEPSPAARDWRSSHSKRSRTDCTAATSSARDAIDDEVAIVDDALESTDRAIEVKLTTRPRARASGGFHSGARFELRAIFPGGEERSKRRQRHRPRSHGHGPCFLRRTDLPSFRRSRVAPTRSERGTRRLSLTH